MGVPDGSAGGQADGDAPQGLSTRGKAGGYQRARPPTEITVADVMEALGDPLYSDEFCDRFAGADDSCVHTLDCSLRQLWTDLDRAIQGVLTRCRLSDLLSAPQPDAVPLGSLAIGRATAR